MEYKIIQSGSKGNAVIINNEILIDCGVPYTKLKDYLKDIKYLFITHKHSDHLKRSTFKSIRSKWKHIKVYSNYEVAIEVGKDEVEKILSTEISYEIGKMEVYPFECIHNVVTTGYVFKINTDNVIYATDTSTLENAPEIKYDYFFIESNHDEKKIELIMNDKSYKYDAFQNAKRHLSTQKAKAFYYTHRRDNNSKFIELHKSERFY